jgi:hypothetical protein
LLPLFAAMALVANGLGWLGEPGDRARGDVPLLRPLVDRATELPQTHSERSFVHST